KEVSDNATISLNDSFKVRYDLVDPLNINRDGQSNNINNNETVLLPQIREDAFKFANGEAAVKVQDDTVIGKGTVTEDRYVELKATYEKSAQVHEAFVQFEVSLDESVIGEKEEYTFTLPGSPEKKLTVKIKENIPAPPEKPKDETKLTKDGGVFNEEGKASWEIAFDSNGRELSDVVLYDLYTCDKNTDMEFIKDSLVIKDESDNELKEGQDYELVVENGDKYTWALKFLNKVSGDKKFNISYDTQINDFSQFVLGNHSVPSNKVWAEYTYTPEDGEPVALKNPGVQKKASGTGIVGHGAIDKYLYSSEPALHQLTWRVVVNRNLQPLTNVVVEEKLGEGLKLVSISDISIEGNGASGKSDVTPDDKEEGKIKFDFGNSLDGKRAVFFVVTELIDDEVSVWEADSTKKYKNSVTLKSNQQEQIDITAYGQCKWSDNLLDKGATVDKSTKRVSYTVNINPKKQILPSRVQIKDVLGKSMNYDKSSVQLFVGNVDANGKVTATEELEQGYATAFDKEDDKETLTITLPEKADNRNAYVLKYVATPNEIVETGDYTNNVKLLGYGYRDVDKKVKKLDYKMFGGGWIEDIDNPSDPGSNSGSSNTTPSSSSSASSGSGSTSSSSSSSSSSSASQTTSAPNKVVGYGETVISIGSNVGNGNDVPKGLVDEEITANSDLGGSLAKTSGFIGTIAAYIVGLLLVAAGVYFIISKKHYKKTQFRNK
ncbi:MAG: hypothetical protein IKW81_07635, partial [Pseudobutyrivibrio sp.]|nr:hypothetical protein [Pseudobutyrivibrio sp.]